MPAAFLSTLPPNVPILGDQATAADADRLFHRPPANFRTPKGRQRRDYAAAPLGALPFSSPFPEHWRIPRPNWPELIEYRQTQKARLVDLLLRSNPFLLSLSQEQTNYCWTNAVITCLETLREFNGLPYVKLSAASVAAPIKGFRNLGGFGGEALAYIVQNGVAPVDLWPANAIDRRYDNDASRQARAGFKITEFWELPPNDFDALASLLLRGIAAAIGLNWWSHEVAALDLVALPGGTFGVLCRNSWGEDYGDGHGFFILTERKATPDDCCAPAVTTGNPGRLLLPGSLTISTAA